MLTLAKAVKEWANSNNESVKFFDDDSIITCFDGEESILVDFDCASLLSFIDKVVAAYKSFDVVDEWQTILECFDIVYSFDKNKSCLFDVLISDYYKYSLDTLVNYAENNACLFVGSSSDYACEFVRDCYDIDITMGCLAMYFDYDALGRDLELGGDIVELGYNLFWTNPNDIY